ncbi:DegT/DnrJ/EryC1/StrS family aminotransferase [Frankia sp. Cpl3]|nr:DegT/DnrJ/EryC1/StrS family aminotransferase [Parafrankia colletiae]MCK9901552.1 DegT/DnrJ/EryC1/StrS family aminotransferase [Frankia sp. Cpl3]
MALFVRHRIDATVADGVFALLALAAGGWPGAAGWPAPDSAGSLLPAGTRADTGGSRTEDGLLCLSVRSAFHLLLSAAELPAGSEIVISAVTHPDMVRIIELHGLRAVPVDIDPGTLAVDEAALDSAVTDLTRALVVTHLFGARSSLDAVARTAHDRGLLLIEDCAQSIQGPDDRGDPRADVSLFSFGLLKTATAMGGAVTWVRRPALAAAMRARHAGWPVQPRRAYAVKVLTCMVALVASHPVLYGLLFGGGCRYDPTALVRSRVPGDEPGFTRWLRRRPCDALARTVARRLAHFPAHRLASRAEAGEAFAAALPPGVFRPGATAARHTHWVFPVVVDDPDRAVDGLRAAGVDATPATSQIAAVEPAPPGATRMLTGLVFVPAYPGLPAARRDLAAAVIAACSSGPAGTTAATATAARTMAATAAERESRGHATTRVDGARSLTGR